MLGEGKTTCNACELRGNECCYKGTFGYSAPRRTVLTMPTGPGTLAEGFNGGSSDRQRNSIEERAACSCNSVFRREAGTPDQGRRLYQRVEEIFSVEMTLDIGEAGLSVGLPFPMTQARLRLADPENASNLRRHIVAEGEPMVAEVDAVQSVVNIIAAVPRAVYAIVDVETMMGILTLRWDSPQLEGRFLYTCSACDKVKDRGLAREMMVL